MVSAVWLGGCDGGSDALSGQIDLLRTKIEAMHTAGGVSAPADQRQKVYTETLATLRGLIEESGSESQKASLALIQGQVNSGLADIEAETVNGLIAEVTVGISSVRSALDLYSSHNALADSMLGYSPAEDLSQLDAQTAMIEQRMAETRRLLAENDQALAAMIAEAAELGAMAQSELDKAARLNMEAMAVTGQERSAMIEQETGHRLEAAKYQRLQSMKQIEIDRATPISDGAEEEITRLQRQLDRLGAARATVREMDRSLTRESEAARGQAEEVATEIARRAEALRSLVEEKLVPAYESAMAKYGAAASDVGRARAAGERGAVSLLAGSIATSAAALAQSQADIAGNLAGLMGELSQVKPSLPGREKFAERESGYEAMSREARNAFQGFAQQAASSLRGSGARGDSAEVLSGIADWYDSRSGGNDSGGDPAITEDTPEGGAEEPADPGLAEDAPNQG